MKGKIFTKDVKTVAVVCHQWGDSGKGKIVDLLGEEADINVRGTGGDNCGHSVCYGGQEYIFHIIPSNILRDKDGQENIIGSGTVVYPRTLYQELKALEERGLSYDHLKLSLKAKLILPTHIVLDRIKEAGAGSNKIGTTGRGIGPAYTDHVARTGLIINDLLNPSLFKAKLTRHLKAVKMLLKNYDSELLRSIIGHQHLENGIYYDPNEIFNAEAIIHLYQEYGAEFKSFIIDTDAYLQNNLGKKNILLEGAQGFLLSIDYGTYPYVTSSDTSVIGLARGAGLHPKDVDLTLGIIKGFYMTRVGNGPFPTELGGSKSDELCNGGSNKENEKATYGLASINDPDEFIQGIAIRQAGNEYGATTGRSRRTGWVDLLLLKLALKVSRSNDVVLTKLDVLNNCETIKVCYQYQYSGGPYNYGRRYLSPGDKLDEAILDGQIIGNSYPIYKEFPGWKCDLKDCQSYDDLPGQLKIILGFIIENTGINPRIISIGPDREETIFV